MKYLLIGFVKIWRAIISPFYGDVCKYYPSCSAYGLEALRVHGAVRGTYLMLRRILHCHPWSLGGIDPVPGSALEAELAAEKSAEQAVWAEQLARIDGHRRVSLLATGSLAGEIKQDVSRETLAYC